MARTVDWLPASRYEMRSTFTPRPETSVKCPSVTPLMRSWKLYARNGSTVVPGCEPLGCVMSGSHRLGVGAHRRLAELEHHELGRLHRRYSDQCHDLARVADVGRVGLLVALDEERLLGRVA